MSTRAYRVNILDVESDPTFNISRNWELADHLGMHEQYSEVSREDLEQAVELAISGELNLCIFELEGLATDIDFCKTANVDTLLYECY